MGLLYLTNAEISIGVLKMNNSQITNTTACETAYNGTTQNCIQKNCIHPRKRKHGTGTLFKRNGVWYYKVMANGKLFCRSTKCKDRDEAEKALKDFSLGHDLPSTKARVAAMQEFLKAETNPTFEEAIETYFSHPINSSQSADARYTDRCRWNSFLGWLHGYQKPYGKSVRGAYPKLKRVNDITPAIASEYIKHCSTIVTTCTINKYLRILKRVWKMNKVEINPWEDFRKFAVQHKRKRALTTEEVARVIDTASGEMRTLFTLGPYTGLRMSDCAKLKWTEINKDITVITTKPNKTKNTSHITVRIPINKVLQRELLSIRRGKGGTGYIMPKLAMLPKWELSKRVQTHFRDCGLDEYETRGENMRKAPIIGFHSFRSTFITNMASVGAPLAMVQSIVGHMSPELTQLYYRADTERARAFVEKLTGA